MDAIADSDEAEIFRTECVIDLIDFKWDAFANATQFWGVVSNIVYSLAMIAYVCLTIIPEQQGAVEVTDAISAIGLRSLTSKAL